MNVIICSKHTELPKGGLWCYVAKTVEEALALHLKRHGYTPPVVYQLRREFYFPIEEAE